MSRPAGRRTPAERDEVSYDEWRAALGAVESGVSVDEAIATVLAARRPAIRPSVGGALDTKSSDEEP